MLGTSQHTASQQRKGDSDGEQAIVVVLLLLLLLPVVPGQAGGGSFQKEKNYIAQKEFAYRMCARRPTSAMPKSFLCCERAFCRSMVVMFCALK